MGRLLVPVAFVSSILAFAVSALTIGFVPDHGAWWNAVLSLAVIGGFIPLIYAVNIRIVPVFARRDWRGENLLRVQMTMAMSAGWLVYAGRLTDTVSLIVAGSSCALLAAMLFTVNTVRLFRQPAARRPAPPLPYPGQARVDKIAIQFTRFSGLYLLFGLAIGLFRAIRTPESGRWDLVWAHSMLLGFVLLMISGVSYHIMTRWTDRHWRSVAMIRLHFVLTATGLPIMLLALAIDSAGLFRIAGPLQAAALGIFLFNVIPLTLVLPALTRFGWMSASTFLIAGVAMGTTFALDPVIGTRLRLAHADINIFGWGGMLISGMVYYLAPRFAGSPLRWPRLAAAQLALLVIGVCGGALSLGLRGYGHDDRTLLWLSQVSVSGSFAILAIVVGLTFRSSSTAAVQSVRITAKPPAIALTQSRPAQVPAPRP